MCATVQMMVQIWIVVSESSPQTASRQVLPTTTHAIFTFCSDLHPCLAVGRTSPRMELMYICGSQKGFFGHRRCMTEECITEES